MTKTSRCWRCREQGTAGRGLRASTVASAYPIAAGAEISVASCANAAAAIEEGVVAGGGVALLHAADRAFEKLDLAGDEATGADIVRVAAEGPLRQIAINIGLEAGVVVERVRSLTTGWGLNAATGEYIDTIAAGILDPAKVTRSALQHAASIAALFLDHRSSRRHPT